MGEPRTGVLVTLSALTPAWGGQSSSLGIKPGSARSASATLRARPKWEGVSVHRGSQARVQIPELWVGGSSQLLSTPFSSATGPGQGVGSGHLETHPRGHQSPDPSPVSSGEGGQCPEPTMASALDSAGPSTCPEIPSPWSPRRWLCFLQPPQAWPHRASAIPLPTAVPWRQCSADQRPHYGGTAGAGHTLPGRAFFPGPLNWASAHATALGRVPAM